MKIDIHAGLTFQVGPMSSNQYGRTDVTFRDIDPDMPLAPQVEAGKKAAQEAFAAVLAQLDKQTEEVYDGKKS